MRKTMMGRAGRTFLSGALVLTLAPSAAWAEGVWTDGAAGEVAEAPSVEAAVAAAGPLSDAELVVVAQGIGLAMVTDDADATLAAATSGTTADGWQWTSNGTAVTLTAYKGTSLTPTVPAQGEGVPVTGVIVNAGAGAVKVTSVDLSAVKTTLAQLKVRGCALTTLDLSGFTALTYVDVCDNQLTSLSLGSCTLLSKLYCSSNQLSALNVSGCTSLTNLYCDNNAITSLDVSALAQLNYLKCNDNKLTGLKVGANVYLNDLYCFNNYISEDLSTLTARYGKDANVILPQHSGTPDPTPTPDPEPTPDPTPTPDPEPTPDPTPDPDPEPTPDPEPQISFSDVTNPADWFYDSVYAAAKKGLITAYAGTTLFGPYDVLTRAQAAVILWRYFEPDASAGYTEDVQAATVNETGMSDVDSASWYTAAANWAVANGVINGKSVGDGRAFDPLGTIDRQQLCAIVGNASVKFAGGQVEGADRAKLDAMPDRDSVADWAKESVAWALNKGVISGALVDGQRHVQPDVSVNRATMAAIMMNSLEEGIL